MEDKIYELLEKMYSELKKDIQEVRSEIGEVKSEIRTVGNQVAKLENDLKPKVESLFDGYKQHTDILERIEKEVTRQDEIIMQRIK